MPERLVQHNGTCTPDIKGVDAGLHGYDGYIITIVKYFPGYPALFIAEYYAAVSGKINLVHRNTLRTEVCRSNGKSILLSQECKRPGQVVTVVHRKFENVSH